MVRHVRLGVVLLFIGWGFVAVQFRAANVLTETAPAAVEAVTGVFHSGHS